MSGWRSLLRRPGILASSVRAGVRYVFGRRGQRRVRGLRLYYRMRAMVVARPLQPLARWTRLNDVRLWVDGWAAFPRLEKLIRRARHSIIVQMFIWKDDATGRAIASRLVEAADRGVNVDVTKEAVGDFFETRGDFAGTQRSEHPVWRRFWNHPRIRVVYGVNRDHAKVYVIDDDVLLLTGMNVADEYRYDWHDYMVELRGRAFVRQYLTRDPGPGDADVRIVMNADDSRLIRPTIMRLLERAVDAVVVEHCYLSDPDVLDALVALSRREVRVTVILPERTDFHHHANMAAVGRLLSEGDGAFLRVLLYPGMIHGKILLVDHKTAFLGSANLMRSSLDEMGEVNVLITDRARQLLILQETLRKDALKSRPITGVPSLVWLSRWLAWLGL